MPFYPTVDQIMLVLMAELPDGVYPEDFANAEDPNQNSSSSAELRAAAMVFGDIYDCLEDANNDNYISTVTEAGLVPWEEELFATAQDSNQPYIVRQQNLLAKRRAIGGLSLPAIHDVIEGILGPVGLNFAIVAYSGATDVPDTTGAWILDESPLDTGTYLGYLDPIIGARQDPGYTPLDCSLNYAAAGLTQQQLTDIQTNAYTYEVLIYGDADSSTLTLLNQQLTALEPARSTHVITNNATAPISADDLGPGEYTFGQ